MPSVPRCWPTTNSYREIDMSHVRMSVSLNNGNSMTLGPGSGVTGNKNDAAEALSTLAKQYRMMRRWLLSQLPPASQPVETRGLRDHIMLEEARASVALSRDGEGATYNLDEHDARCASQTGWGDYCTCATIRAFE